MQHQLRRLIWFILYCSASLSAYAQSNPDDYWLNHGFVSGQTIFTNSGFFYDDGGSDLYGINQNWSVRFCSENGNPITFDFQGFRTDYRGPFPDPPEGAHLAYDYLRIQYPGVSYDIYNDDTPQLSFTSPDRCMNFTFRSQETSLRDSGWIAEISANPPPSNNDPCSATLLSVGNACSPAYFTNKGAYNTTNLNSPSCHKYYGGDVWFTATVPASEQLKIETFPGSLTYAIMVLYTGACDILTEEICSKNVGSMPSAIINKPAGTVVTIRIFGDQAKSGTFGICATDPTAPVTGFSGPGGVGNFISNSLWLRADKGILNNSDLPAETGEAVKSWLDMSGNLKNLTQSVADKQPSLLSDFSNETNALGFDGVDDYFASELGTMAAPIDIFVVNRFSEIKDQTVTSIGNANNDNTLSISRDVDNRYYSFTGEKRFGPEIETNTTGLLFVRHNIMSPFHNLKIQAISQTVADYPVNISTNGAFFLGSSRDVTGFFNGDMGELIIFNKTLNEAQEIIVHNYLAAKYGLDIGSYDKYAWKLVHRHDVAGIGQVNAANIHSKARSADILAIGGADDLEDNEFLLFGHDNGGITSWVNDEIPDGDTNIQRIAREWRVNITGGNGVGKVSISISDSLLPPLNPGFIAYNIIVNSDGDFTNGTIAYGLVKNGNEFIANDIALNDGDYISIASVKPFVGFMKPASSGFENVPNPVIDVYINYAISDPFEVDYSITSGTATGGGVDYSLNPGKLLFNPGQRFHQIIPLIIDDDEVEIPDEYFVIELTNPTAGVQVGDINAHTYTILNDDIDIEITPSNIQIGACITSKDTIRATVNGTGPFTYSWSPVEGLSHPGEPVTEANPLTTTKYYLSVTDNNGFVKTDSISVTVDPLPAKPVISPQGPIYLLIGQTITLESSPAFSYLWSPGGENTQNIVVGDPGTYSVSISDINNCQSEISDPVIVTVGDKLPKPDITIIGSTELCAGDNVELISSEAHSYLWSTGETTRNIIITTGGNYTVTIKNSSGDESFPSDLVTITVNPNPQITLSKSDVSCFGGDDGLANAVASGGQAPYDYRWSDNSSSEVITNISAGTYSVTVTDIRGCKSTEEVEVNQPPQITVSSQISHAWCPDSHDGSISLTAEGGVEGFMFEWSTGNNGSIIYDLSPATYEVEVSDANNCKITAGYDIDYLNAVCFKVPGIITPNGDGKNDEWLIEGIEFYPEVSIEIYNRWGERVFYSKGYTKPWDGTFHGKELPMESYHYIINLHNGSTPLIGNITIVR